jgi:ribosome-associated protein
MLGDKALTPELAECVEAARDRKAEDIVILDLRGLSDVTDHFFICQGTSDRQVLAIADSIEERLFKNRSLKPSHVEGRRISDWILMDYIDFVVHIFVAEKRAFYRLERLWGDAPLVDVPEAGPPDGTAGPQITGQASAS